MITDNVEFLNNLFSEFTPFPLRVDFMGEISVFSFLFETEDYEPISAVLNEQPIIINPAVGTFQFIYDFETFSIEKNVTVVGFENAENFRHIEKQRYLFENIKPLFVSRYPQNQHKDLIRWLQSIENQYLHFGDFDLAGIRIFLSEYFRHLGDKATFFIPSDIESRIEKYGSSKRYDSQHGNIKIKDITDEKLLTLIKLILSHKKGLDQEALIGGVE